MDCKKLSLKSTARFLSDKNNIVILCHDFPDGDTLGSAAALHLACLALNKTSKILCNSEIPDKFQFMFKNIKNINFKPDMILTIDVADPKLLGDNFCKIYKNSVDLCIDHHSSNINYSNYLLLEPSASATAEIVYKLILEMGVNITPDIANCLYTAICTDTGCFKFSNVTAETHQIAAKLIKFGAESHKINKIMFDTKSKKRLQIESSILENLSYHFNGKCALTFLDFETFNKLDATESDLDGIASIPIQIENVEIAIYIREKSPNHYKISLRTNDKISASDICRKFNGGGHPCAAACELSGNLESVKKRILDVISENKYLEH